MLLKIGQKLAIYEEQEICWNTAWLNFVTIFPVFLFTFIFRTQKCPSLRSYRCSHTSLINFFNSCNYFNFWWYTASNWCWCWELAICTALVYVRVLIILPRSILWLTFNIPMNRIQHYLYSEVTQYIIELSNIYIWSAIYPKLSTDLYIYFTASQCPTC